MKQICAGTWKVWCDWRAIATAMPWNWQSWKAVFSSIPQVGYLIWLVCFLDWHYLCWPSFWNMGPWPPASMTVPGMLAIDPLCVDFSFRMLTIPWAIVETKFQNDVKREKMPRFTIIAGKANTQNLTSRISCLLFADVTCIYNKILNYFLSPSLPVCFFILVGSQCRSLGRELRALENTLPQLAAEICPKSNPLLLA